MPLSTILKYGASIAVCLCVIFPQVSASAATLNNPSLETAYAAYIKKLEKKKSQSSMQAYLEKLNSTLALIEEKKKLSTKQKKIVEDLYRLNNEQLFTYDLANIGGTDIGQKIIETNEKNSLKSEIKTPVIPNYITAILATNRQLTVTTDGYEFVSNNAIKKFQFRTYFKIDPSNYTAFLSKTGQVINISGTQNFLFVEDYEIEEKIPYTKLGERMKFAFDDETKFQLEEGVWYSYNFEKYFFFEDRYGLYISSLEANGLQAENLLLYRTSAGKYTFIKEYEKVKLVSDIYIYGVSDKYNFLQNIINDKKYETGDTDLDFDALRKDTEALISGLKPSQRIPAIYNFVLDRLSYTESFTLENKKISSGILAYKNEDGICEGYAKLFAYMLNYAYISDVEVRRGFVIDAQDFPEVGHAWVRVGEAYYDPTFDDPI
ncbi:MAG: hypothetical protein H6767_01465 [Candidatus Peribacteria bacterium]|nr:MAG: hypothetical protein H6767_01465 [Candidatus Peribacteria bacterium]